METLFGVLVNKGAIVACVFHSVIALEVHTIKKRLKEGLSGIFKLLRKFLAPHEANDSLSSLLVASFLVNLWLNSRTSRDAAESVASLHVSWI